MLFEFSHFTIGSVVLYLQSKKGVPTNLSAKIKPLLFEEHVVLERTPGNKTNERTHSAKLLLMKQLEEIIHHCQHSKIFQDI